MDLLTNLALCKEVIINSEAVVIPDLFHSFVDDDKVIMKELPPMSININFIVSFCKYVKACASTPLVSMLKGNWIGSFYLYNLVRNCKTITFSDLPCPRSSPHYTCTFSIVSILAKSPRPLPPYNSLYVADLELCGPALHQYKTRPGHRNVHFKSCTMCGYLCTPPLWWLCTMSMYIPPNNINDALLLS